jgi:hypothetical protein
VIRGVQLPTWLGHVITSGEITLFTDDKEALHLKVGNKKISLDVVDKKFVKDILGSLGGRTSIRSRLDLVKGIAVELRDEGLTISVSYKGGRAVTIGAEAKPKLSRVLTGTNAIEINSLRKLIELGV